MLKTAAANALVDIGCRADVNEIYIYIHVWQHPDTFISRKRTLGSDTSDSHPTKKKKKKQMHTHKGLLLTADQQPKSIQGKKKLKKKKK